MVQARAHQNTKAFATKYTRQTGVEGTIRQAVAVSDIRHARYRSLPKTHLQLALAA